MKLLRVLLCVPLGLALGCGSSSGTPTPSPNTPAPVVSASPTTSATAAISSNVTAAQSISVGKALFPPDPAGGYTECDKGLSQISNCPFSNRLKAQIAKYLSNYQSQCPGGCGGALLLIRDQCGTFPSEQVTNAPNQTIAIVTLSGDTTCRGVDKTFYVSVVLQNGVPVADDIDCNVGDDKYGMYNPDPNATGPPVCAT